MIWTKGKIWLGSLLLNSFFPYCPFYWTLISFSFYFLFPWFSSFVCCLKASYYDKSPWTGKVWAPILSATSKITHISISRLNSLVWDNLHFKTEPHTFVPLPTPNVQKFRISHSKIFKLPSKYELVKNKKSLVCYSLSLACSVKLSVLCRYESKNLPWEDKRRLNWDNCMFKETLESTQNSKYQRAHFRMMMREPEFLIPGNGKKYKKRCVWGG